MSFCKKKKIAPLLNCFVYFCWEVWCQSDFLSFLNNGSFCMEALRIFFFCTYFYLESLQVLLDCVFELTIPGQFLQVHGRPFSTVVLHSFFNSEKFIILNITCLTVLFYSIRISITCMWIFLPVFNTNHFLSDPLFWPLHLPVFLNTP